ncbi:TRAP transporter substrate-binding protein [Spiractinospora alimapuensis]|uniref:TRAP transporter substrate-binding protein n=1 Tax=Spiractinospora alimapuensis TaxID=2820884 RepID=UPI001F34B58F|nr:TRAP transporter substrate-binding protein [Spiractinospora alimapuensis]QVQ51258.1 TRAP transporter substrate-binding protein [Spiractinospora alimapuensis]
MRSSAILATLSAVALTVSLAACSDVGAAEQDAELTLRLGHTYGVDSLPNRAAQRLAETVEEETDGAVTIEVYPSSQLGSWEEMQEGLELGGVDMVIESVGSLERYTDLAAIEGIPFLYESDEQFFSVWDGEVGADIIDTLHEETGFLLLGDLYRGPRVLNSARPIESPGDLAGLKLRVPTQQTYIDTWQALGASPTPLALNEVFGAIEQGAIEAQENPIDVVRFNSYFEVAPYVTNTNHLYGNFHFQTWGDTYESWDEEHRAAIDQAIDEVSAWAREVSLDEQSENVEFLEEEDVTFYEIDQEEWRSLTSELIDEADPQVQEWAERIAEH